MELAEEVLALFYQARDVIQSIRSPFGYGGEGETRKPTPNEHPEDKAALDQAYVIIERYNRHNETFARIHALRYRFMAQFGVDAAVPFNELNSIVGELFLASRRQARLVAREERASRSDSAYDKYQKKKDEIEAVLYIGEEDDPTTRRIGKAVEQIERTCRSIIESHETLFALLNRRAGDS